MVCRNNYVFNFILNYCNIVTQELQSEVSSLEDSRDELIEHADFVVNLLKPHSKDAAKDTERNVKELVETYEK